MIGKALHSWKENGIKLVNIVSAGATQLKSTCS